MLKKVQLTTMQYVRLFTFCSSVLAAAIFEATKMAISDSRLKQGLVDE